MPVQGAGGVGVADAENGALDKDGSLHFGEASEPLAKGATPSTCNQVRDLGAGEGNGAVILDAGTWGIGRGDIRKGAGVVAMHDGKGTVEHAVANETGGSGGIVAGVDIDGGDGILDQAESLRFIPQHQRGKPVHLDGGGLGFEHGFAVLT